VACRLASIAETNRFVMMARDEKAEKTSRKKASTTFELTKDQKFEVKIAS